MSIYKHFFCFIIIVLSGCGGAFWGTTKTYPPQSQWSRYDWSHIVMVHFTGNTWKKEKKRMLIRITSDDGDVILNKRSKVVAMMPEATVNWPSFDTIYIEIRDYGNENVKTPESVGLQKESKLLWQETFVYDSLDQKFKPHEE